MTYKGLLIKKSWLFPCKKQSIMYKYMQNITLTSRIEVKMADSTSKCNFKEGS